MGHLVESKHEEIFLSELHSLVRILKDLREQTNSVFNRINILEKKLLPYGDRLILDVIIDVTIRHFHINESDMSSDLREGSVMKARRIFCSMGYNRTGSSYAKVGAIVNRDHATVINACKKMRNYRDTHDVLYR